MLVKKVFIIFLLLLLNTVYAQARYKHKHKAHGEASYYAEKYNGRKTADGTVFTNNGFTAASNKFRLGAYAKVINRENGNVVYVLINDRMGNKKRVIDLTTAAAKKLDFIKQGTAKVKVKVVKPGKGKRKIRKQMK